MKKEDKLLKKKGWTGEEIGRLLINSLIESKASGDPDHQPSVSQTDFEKMVHTLSAKKDYDDYNFYTVLYNSLYVSGIALDGEHQQFKQAYRHYTDTLERCTNAEEIEHICDSKPLIMTQAQYDRTMEIAGGITRGYEESYCRLVLSWLLDCDEEDVPAEIKEVLDDYKTRPATGNRYLPIYNDVMGNGYLSLPDGTRSDQLTELEWQEALFESYGVPKSDDAYDAFKDFSVQRLSDTWMLLYQGIDGIKRYYKEKTGHELNLSKEDERSVLRDLDSFSHGTTQFYERASEELQKLYVCLGYKNATAWHSYTELPEDLSLYDMIPVYDDVYRDSIDTPEEKDVFKAFKEDMPELYEAIKAYTESKLEKAKDLKPSQYFKPFTTWGELADCGYWKYDRLTTTDGDDLNNHCDEILEILLKEEGVNDDDLSALVYSYSERIRSKGIAISTKKDSSLVSLNGDYSQALDMASNACDILRLPEDTERLDLMNGYATKLIYPSIRFMYGYNALVEILSRQYGVPDLKYMGVVPSNFEEKVKAYNALLYNLYNSVYGCDEVKEKKRAIIKEYMPELELECFKPSEEAIQEVEDELRSLGTSNRNKMQIGEFFKLVDRLGGKGAY